MVLKCCTFRTVSTINSGSARDRSTGSKKERKASAAARFTIYKVNKASRKKREKSSAKKERKATKTLAIVLGKHAEIYGRASPYFDLFEGKRRNAVRKLI